MKILLAAIPCLLMGCATDPASSLPHDGKDASQPSLRIASDPFPAAKDGVTIPSGDARPSATLATVLADFERATDVHVFATIEIQGLMQKITIDLPRPLVIPPDEVWEVVESLLIANNCCLRVMHDTAPFVLAAESLQGAARTNLRNNARYVPTADLPAWSRHPAILITTALDLDAVDVRNLSNSMRQMFTDANTQQVIPIGNSNMLLLTGFGANVAALVRMLQECNESERKRVAEHRPVPGAVPVEQK